MIGEIWRHDDGREAVIVARHTSTKRPEVMLCGGWLPYDDLPALGWRRLPDATDATSNINFYNSP